MDIRFRVLWRPMWRSLTIYMVLAVSIPITIMAVIRVMKRGMPNAFPHVSLLGVVVGVIASVAACSLVALIIAQFTRLYTVQLTDDFIEGRNYRGKKKKIPLNDIVRLSRYSEQGVNAIVVSNSINEEIYIPAHTENLQELITLLATYLPKQVGTGNS